MGKDDNKTITLKVGDNNKNHLLDITVKGLDLRTDELETFINLLLDITKNYKKKKTNELL